MANIPPLNLSKLLPLACGWADRQQNMILTEGVPLTDKLLQYALQAGVKYPEKVRILVVKRIPLPENQDLAEACRLTRLISDQTIGLTVGHGIFIREDSAKDYPTLVHELAHVAQYERLGGTANFLTAYLGEIASIGYPQAPMEQEAINKAERICTSLK